MTTPVFLAMALCFVSTGLFIICVVAPKMPMGNSCRRFILIAPLYQSDPWGEKAAAEPDSWWVHAIEYASYVVIICCTIYPILGFFVLFIIVMCMMWEFIQKITETGRYAQQEEQRQ